jgi:hypothetical protein
MKRRSFMQAAAAGGCALLPGIAPAATTSARPDVRALSITYQAAPAQRAALRAALEGEASERLRRWRAEGVIAGSRILVNRHADSDLWDAMAIIEFPASGPDARWAALERSFPGALAPNQFAQLVSVHTVPVDLLRRRAQAPVPASPVVLAIPYQALVSAADYLAYADGYALPQFDGWVREGVLAGYSLWSASFPAGRPWNHLLLLEYRDDAALARRDAVVAKVRAELKNNPEWRAISESKAKIREEKQPVVCEDLRSVAL